jgi:hypothetical protein
MGIEEGNMTNRDDFLRDNFKDCREEMRGRREQEFRLVQYLLIFYPVVVTAMVAVAGSDIDPSLCRYLSYGVSAFLFLVSLLVTNRIFSEHRAYAAMGKSIQKVWRYFGLFETGVYLPDEAMLPARLMDAKKGIGQGRGHVQTVGFIWAITITVIVLILALGFF